MIAKKLCQNLPEPLKNRQKQGFWQRFQEFCEKMRQLTDKAIRLPTEAEWEYACRAGTTTESYSGNLESDLDKVAWYNSKSSHGPHQVGFQAPNKWGLFDMHGNIFEGCAGWMGPYSGEGQTDPAGPSFGNARVHGDGAWNSQPKHCRAAARTSSASTYRGRDIGLRVCFRPD
jgi:formylglycine-generating enzyme required for sulfatase activity